MLTQFILMTVALTALVCVSLSLERLETMALEGRRLSYLILTPIFVTLAFILIISAGVILVILGNLLRLIILALGTN